MGFFDNIVKSFNSSEIKDGFNQIGKGLDKFADDVEKEFNNSGLKEDIKKVGQDLGVTSSSNNTNNTANTKTVPEEYKSFPQFEGTIGTISTKKIDKYHRCTIDYTGVTNEAVDAYVSKIEAAGFTKGSDVRYDKDNTYIIVERDIPGLHLVFHVKH